MNERIEIDNENQGWIRQSGKSPGTVVFQVATKATTNIAGLLYDDDALRALLDVINSKLATGNFGALRDTDSRPFVGKRMRVKHTLAPTQEVTVEEIAADGVIKFRTDNGGRGSDLAHKFHGMIDPTPPKPVVVRAWTEQEAATFIGRSIKFNNGGTRKIRAVIYGGVEFEGGGFDWLATLASHYVLTDDSSPCGVTEPTA